MSRLLGRLTPKVQTVRMEGGKPTALDPPTTAEYLASRVDLNFAGVMLFNLGRSVRYHRLGWGVVLAVAALWVWLGSLVQVVIVLVALTGLAGVLLWGSASRYGGRPGLRRSLLALSRKRSVNRTWGQVCALAGLTGVGGDPVPISEVRTTPTGVRFTAYPGRVGLSASSVATKATAVTSMHFASQTRVTRGRSPLTWWERLLGARPILTDAVCDVQIDWGNPLERVWRLEDLPPSPAGRVVVGLDEDGKPVTLSLLHSILVGGVTGSGKSNLIWAMLAALEAAGVPFRLFVLDPAEGMELSYLDPRNGGIAAEYEDNPQRAKALVKKFRQALAEQGRRLRSAGERKLTDFTDGNPFLVLVMDEALLADLDMSADGELVQTVVAARKYGGAVWAATQVGTVDAIARLGTTITQKVGFALPTREQTDAVLGERAYANGALCPSLVVTQAGEEDYELRDDQRGVGFTAKGQGRFVMFRSVLVTDDEARLIGRGEVPEALWEAIRTQEGLPAGGDGAVAPVRFGSAGTRRRWLYRARGRWVDESTGEVERDAFIYGGQTRQLPTERWAQHDRDKDWAAGVRVWYQEEVPVQGLSEDEAQAKLDAAERAMIQGEPFVFDPEDPHPGQVWGEEPKANELLRNRDLAPAATRPVPPVRGGGRSSGVARPARQRRGPRGGGR